MATNWDDAYFVRREATDNLADIYGVNKKDHLKKSIFGERGFTAKDYEDYEKAISRAANSDYDTRRPIEAAKLADYEGADELSNSVSDLKETEQAYNFLNDYHKNVLNKSNVLKSRKDFADVTNSFVNMDRDKLQDSFSDYGSKSGQDPAEEPADVSRDSITDTDAYKNYQQRERNAGGITIDGIGDNKNKEAAQIFADNYKLNLMR